MDLVGRSFVTGEARGSSLGSGLYLAVEVILKKILETAMAILFDGEET